MSRRLSKLTHLDLRGLQVVNGSDATTTLITNCQQLINFKTEWKCNDTALSYYSTLSSLTHLSLCTRRAGTGIRNNGITSDGWKNSFNHGLVESLQSLSIGGGIGSGICDEAISVTLSLATALTSLSLSKCTRITDGSFIRMGEGRGLIGVFVSNSFKTCTIDTTNTTICRIDSIPEEIKNRLRGKYKRLHR